MHVTHYERLQKMRAMTLRCKGALGDDFGTVMAILDSHIRMNRLPTHTQMRIRGQVDAACGA